MNFKAKLQRAHGHLVWVGLLGIATGAILMIWVPSLPGVSHTILLFAGFHIIGAGVLLASAYSLGGRRLAAHLFPQSRRSDTPDFGWAPGWILGPWIAALILLSVAAVIEVAVPQYWPFALTATALAVSFFAGGLIVRTTREYRYAVLPMVDLLPGDKSGGLVLDAGSGAGRTTLALGRAAKDANIVALDRFDSGYIEGGGRALLEHNLRVAGMADRVRIERGDLTSLPFPEQSFDAAVSAHAIDHLGTKKEQALREIRRVLKPGARFLLIVWVPGWTMFAVANLLAFSLSPKKAWRSMAGNVGFEIADDGMFNGYWFAVLRRPEQE